MPLAICPVLMEVTSFQINSVNELVLTELILENTLAKYTPEETVALLSCFVFQEKAEVEHVISLKLEEGRDAIMAISDRIDSIQDAYKVSGEEYRSSVNPGLMEVVYEWANGMVKMKNYRLRAYLIRKLAIRGNNRADSHPRRDDRTRHYQIR